MILRLREGHREISITKAEAEALTTQLANGAEVILIKGYTIMRGDIAHIDPSGLSREEIDELEKRALPEPVKQRASDKTISNIREIIHTKGLKGLKKDKPKPTDDYSLREMK